MKKIKDLIAILKYIKSNSIFGTSLLMHCVKFVKWQIGTLILRNPVVIDWVDNSKLIINRGDAGLTGNVYCGLADPVEMGFLLHVLTSDDVFIDVGANQGAYSILASAVVGAKTFAFEPIPTTIKKLNDQIRINCVEDLAIVVPKGAGDIKCNLSFTMMDDTINHVITDNNTNTCNAVNVETISLDEYFQDEISSRLIMKIDVEGYEYKVLVGCEKLLRLKCFLAIIIEINDNAAKYGVSESQIETLLIENGYHHISYDPFERKIFNFNSLKADSINKIFVRDVEEVTKRIKKGKRFKLRMAENIEI